MKRTLRPIAFLPPVVLAASLARADRLPPVDAYHQGRAAGGARAASPGPAGPSWRREASARGAVVAAVDARRGVPSLLWASPGAAAARGGGATAEAAAKAYLGRYAPAYGLPGAEVEASSRVTSVHDTGAGAVVVGVRQQVGDVEVFRSDVKVLLTRGLELFAIAGSPHATAGGSAAAVAKKGKGFRLTAEQALARAFGDAHGASVGAEAFVDAGRAKGAYRYFEVRAGALGPSSLVPGAGLRAKAVYFPLPERLVPAYYVETAARVGAAGAEEAYAYVIAADDGRVLYRGDLVAYESYTYKVFAHDDPARNYPPADGPLVDHTPFPAGADPLTLRPEFAAPLDVPMAGFNRSGDPWLPAGAAVTSGNNVDAYADHDEVPAEGATPGANDGNDPPGDPTPDPTAEVSPPGSRAFPYAYDLTREPLASDAQIKAAVTQLFYTTNWLHDYWYDSGFDEAAGVAQNSNFGRVKDARGAPVTAGEGDAMEAQAQDKFFAGSRDNANMFTPADGEPPRMQMFVSRGRVLASRLTTTAPSLPTAQLRNAIFGPKNYDLPATAAVLVGDGGGPAPGTTSDGCQPLTNAAAVAGKVAVVDPGGCLPAVKAVNAQRAGAAAVLLVDDESSLGGAFGGVPSEPVTVPVGRLWPEDGAAFKAALAAGGVQVSLARSVEVDADGTLDNGTIAHEWGHYLHHRLVFCGSTQCAAMSEGWGDFVALHMIVRPGDDLGGTFDGGDYGDRAFDGAAYFGVRRYPYSIDRGKNPLTFKHVANKNALPASEQALYNPRWVYEGERLLPNAEVHSAGEVWAVTLFDAYVNLLRAHPFDEAKRRMANYVVGGMKMAPAEPTFTQQRDAILAYVYASDRADYERVVTAFVGRGLGIGAKSPPPFGGLLDEYGDASFDEAEESDVRKGELAVEAARFDESIASCDGDGVVDADETGEVTFTLGNVGMARVAAADVDVTTDAPGVTVTSGRHPSSLGLDPYGRLVVRVGVALGPEVAPRLAATFAVKVKSADSFTAEVPVTLAWRGNYDEKKGASEVDGFEAAGHGWTPAGAVDAPNPKFDVEAWRRVEAPPAPGASLDHRWHGADLGARADVTLESPDVAVGPGPFALAFEHRFRFETTPADGETPATYWDGGVVEVGEVNAAGGVDSWQDVSTFAAAGYNAPSLGLDFGPAPEDDASENPLLGRPGFGGDSEGYDEGTLLKAELDFGTKLAGKTVRFRFRIGSDANGGAAGWEVDNVKVTGAASPPFTALVDDAGACVGLPVARAGDDLAVTAGAPVALDASGSTDPDGQPLAFAWEQLSGPEVALDGATGAKAAFTAPDVTEATTLTFRVRASDGRGFSTDAVDVRVSPALDGAGGAAGGGAGPAGGASAGPKGNVIVAGGANDDGCGCATAGSHGARGSWLAALGAGLALLRRRRDRRRA